MTASPAVAPVRIPPDGPRLLPSGGSPSYAAHVDRHGPLPSPPPERIVALARAARLVGRGGAGFPVWRKLTTAATAGAGVVVANAAESEPASAKDRTLLAVSPQLVLDGLALAARASGAQRLVLYAHEGPAYALAAKAVADRSVAAGRDIGVEVVAAPARFIAGQESALANAVGGGPALPRSGAVWVQGVRGRPTLVQNVETLAHLALLVRYGAGWFVAASDPESPGSMLHTVSTAGDRELTVIEAPTGVPYADLLRAARRDPAPAALLVGGFHGAWLTGAALTGPGTRAALAVHGVTPGAGVAVALPHGACPLAYVAGVLTYLAGESAGQCGPCVNGLPALAAAFDRLVAGDPAAPGRVAELAGLVAGRGGCHHPDGTARLVRSSLRTFAADVEAHLRGACRAAVAA